MGGFHAGRDASLSLRPSLGACTPKAEAVGDFDGFAYAAVPSAVGRVGNGGEGADDVAPLIDLLPS